MQKGPKFNKNICKYVIIYKLKSYDSKSTCGKKKIVRDNVTGIFILLRSNSVRAVC